jgi:hypothetical protein
MKINCLECGFNFDIDEAYEDYEGEIKCYVCHHLLSIKTVEGHIKSVRSAISPLPAQNPGLEARL